MRKEKVTIQDIADALGLSRNTVSKALNGNLTLPTETRDKVIQKAIELNYKQFAYIDHENNMFKTSGNIALLTSNMPNNSHFGTSLLSGLEQKISSKGYNLSIHIVREAEIDALLLPANFDKTKVDGIVCIELFNKKYSDFINDLGIPTIFIDSSADMSYIDLKADLILMENEHSVFSMTRQLIDGGRKTLGFVGDFKHCMSFYERWNGYSRALRLSNLDVMDSFNIVDDDRYIADINWLQEKLNKMEHLPSAFVCANDYIAINVMKILKNMSINIPEDVAICGFDDSAESQIVEPHLTTVHIYRSEMGIQTAEILLSRIKNPDKPSQVIHIKTTPIFRNSTANID